MINNKLQKLHRLIRGDLRVYCLDGNKRNVTRCNLSPTRNPKYKGELEIRRTVLIGDRFREEKKQFNNKDEAKRYFFWLFSIPLEDFLDSKLEYQAGIPLKNGGFALVDEKDIKNVLGCNWYFHKKYGVIAIEDGQIIRLHSLIAPYWRVYHKNGNKKDCRKENLVRPPLIKKDKPQTKFRELGVREEKDCFRIVRRIDGKTAGFCFKWGFWKKKEWITKDKARKAAEEKLIEFKSYTKEQLRELYMEYKRGRNLDAWDLWRGKEWKLSEM